MGKKATRKGRERETKKGRGNETEKGNEAEKSFSFHVERGGYDCSCSHRYILENGSVVGEMSQRMPSTKIGTL